MTKNVLIGAVSLIAILALCVGAYVYTHSTPPSPEQLSQMLPSQPNNAVAAGPVVSSSATSITIRKQDATQATFSITDATVVLVGQDGQSAAPASPDAIKNGMIVLITPSGADAKAAQSIVIVPPPLPVGQ